MKRLYLTVEGQTEQAFAVDVLQPHLAEFQVFVVKPRLTGLHARRKGRIPAGGLLSTFRHTLGDMQRWLREARIKQFITDYDQRVDGPILAVGIGVEAIRAKCPHFHQWLTRLERLDEEHSP